MKRTIDITSEQRKTLLALLARHLPDTTVWVYGSRIQWTARPQSDLDMLVFASPSQNGRVSALREALEESNLPFRVDLFVWDDVPDQFRKHIEAEYAVLVKKEELSVVGEWRDLTLGEIAEIVGGSTPSTKEPDNFDGDIPWLTPKDLAGTHDRYILRGARNLSQKGLDSCSAKLLPRGAILISTRAPIGYVAIAKNQIATNQGFRSLILRDEFIPEYIYYWIGANISELEKRASGTTFPELSGSSLKQIRVSIPSIAFQRAIAHILGTLDDKIELNRRMNETMEAMAQALFKSWFVDFDPVHAKATLKRHDALLSLRQEDFAKSQSNAPSHTRITPPLRGSRQDKGEARRRIATTSITPPLRGSRQDKGASPPSSRWGVIKRQYSQQTLQNAKVLRQNQTNAEGLLWHYLRNKQMDGHKFRRQQPIGPYIVDFACMPRKLIVELDGGQHAKQEAYDEKRDTFLQDKGYRILRFWNNEVFENCFGVLESIYNALHHHPPLEGGSKDASLSERGSPPPHQPSPAGSVSATPPRGGSDFHGEAMKDEFRGNTPQGGSEWTPERTRAYLDSMDDDIMALFPDSFEDSELGKIPKGWEVKTLEENGTIITGKTPSTRNPNFYGDDVPLLKIPDMHGKIYVVKTSTMLSIKGASSQPTKSLPSGSVSVSCIASPGLVVLNHQETHTNQQINSIIPIDKQTSKYLYWTCRKLSTEIISGSSGGSIFGNMNKSTFGALQILNPESTLVRMFDILITPIHNKILLNEQQRILLTHIRDMLLPKLVSGEIRIHEIEKLKEETI